MSAPAAGVFSAAPDLSAIDAEPIRAKVADYWKSLRLTDEVLIGNLVEDCLNRARLRVGRASSPELLRRAIEEAQRRFDHALASAIGLPPSNDPHPLAAARAALLLTPGLSADSLFRHDASTRELKERLESLLPQSTPPESHVSMTPVPLRFWLFKSTDH